VQIRDRRLSKGWTQEQLAEASGLSIRTIQRIENGQSATLESIKCLAAVFETSVHALTERNPMQTEDQEVELSEHTRIEEDAIEQIQNLKGLYVHAVLFVTIILGLLILNLVISPSQLWIKYVAVSWGFALCLHAIIFYSVTGLFGTAWEQRKFSEITHRD